MPPPRGGICGRLTEDLPSTRLQGGVRQLTDPARVCTGIQGGVVPGKTEMKRLSEGLVVWRLSCSPPATVFLFFVPRIGHLRRNSARSRTEFLVNELDIPIGQELHDTKENADDAAGQASVFLSLSLPPSLGGLDHTPVWFIRTPIPKPQSLARNLQSLNPQP